MNRFAGRAWLSVAGVAIVLAIAHVADAQREGGRGGRGGGGFGHGGGGFALTTVQLATAQEVQAALNLTDEQRDKIAKINDELRQARRKLRDQGGGDFRQMAAEMKKLNDESVGKLSEVLDDTQNQRLVGILAQVDVNGALTNSTIVKELNITDEQKDAIAVARDRNGEAMRDAFRDLQNLSGEERAAKIDELRTEANKKLMATLTSDQQAQYEALKGEPVKIDMSQFRPFGGRGQGGGRGGDGGGRRGNRGSAAERSSDRGA